MVATSGGFINRLCVAHHLHGSSNDPYYDIYTGEYYEYFTLDDARTWAIKNFLIALVAGYGFVRGFAGDFGRTSKKKR